MTPSRRSLLQFTGLTIAAALAGRASADAPARVEGIALTPSASGLRLDIGVNGAAQARTFFLSNPDRFVIDLTPARLAPGAAVAGAAGLAAGCRFAAHPDERVRVVLDLAAPARLAAHSVTARSGGLRFDLEATGPVPLVVAGPVPLVAPRARRIVIDPGHGGRDPGAVGVTGVREKDVVLDAALKVREALQAQGGFEVALTRSDDSSIALEERVNFARQHNADLFISLHADSHANHDAHGASVYTLSERGAERTPGVAAAQNWDIDLGGARRGGIVGDILMDLAQRETTNKSAAFAQEVIQELGSVGPLLRNTHRNAGFFVLLAPDVPAVLIETGFLSNVDDERRLNDPRQRQQTAQAIAAAVSAYFAPASSYAAR